MSRVCTNCGASGTASRSKFCAECGQRLPPATSSSSPRSSTPFDASAPPVVSAFRPSDSAFGGQTYHHPLPLSGKTVSPPSALRSTTTSISNSNNNNNSNSNSHFNTMMNPSALDVVPPAATGADALQLYEQCVQTIRAAQGGRNDRGVKAFKLHCRQFGLKEMTVERFYASIVAELGGRDTSAFVPTLARLVPDDARRQELVQYNAKQQRLAIGTNNHNHNSNSNSNNNGRSVSYSNSNSSSNLGPTQSSALVNRHSSLTPLDAAGVVQKKGLLTNRYADHPNCDVCSVRFDVTKRRHQCRLCGLFVCSSCSPVRLLVPPARVIDGAKKYDASLPQRVCIQCAPELHPLQDELVATYAQSQTDNVHEARSRLHIPYTNSLNKECCNAADVIGNFFRNDWGSSADRAIPVAFLQKAHGLAVMTVIKAGFLVSGTIGTGLVVAKLPDGSWSAPSAIGTFGLSGGFEIGGELIEVMIILGSEGAVKVFHKPQGAIVAARSDMNRKFYGRDLQPSELLSGYVEQPAAARPLYEAIDNAMRGVVEHKEEQQRRSSIMGMCRQCNCPMYQAHTTQVWNKKCKSCNHAH